MSQAKLWTAVGLILLVNIAWSLIGIKTTLDRTQPPTYSKHIFSVKERHVLTYNPKATMTGTTPSTGLSLDQHHQS
jgi:hypothetical protein